MTSRRKYTALFALSLFLMLAGYCSLWLRTQQRQYALDRQLIAALVKNDTKVAIARVNEGANPNTRYKPAAVPALPELVRQLLHRSAPPTNDSPTAFLIACGADWDDAVADTAHGHRPDSSDLVRTMLRHGAKVNAKDRNGITPLMWAVADNRRNSVSMLLEQGAAVDAKDADGRTPLMLAATNDATQDIMPLLVAHGANVNAKDLNGRTPLMYAVLPLTWAGIRTNAAEVSHDAPNTVRLLLEHGADVNAKDTEGTTTLMYEVRWQADTHIVRLLLEHGAEVNIQAEGGGVALYRAMRYIGPKQRASACIRLLIAHGADPKLLSLDGDTALTLARKRGFRALIPLFRQAGATE